MDYMESLKYWDSSLCDSCMSSAELDEYVDGKPACRGGGRCKHLADPRADMLDGAPYQYVTAGGLLDLLIQFGRMVELSPIDGHGPRLDALGWIEWVCPIEQDEYIELLTIYLDWKRLEWLAEMKKKKTA